jgi:hypothetical protein
MVKHQPHPKRGNDQPRIVGENTNPALMGICRDMALLVAFSLGNGYMPLEG